MRIEQRKAHMKINPEKKHNLKLQTEAASSFSFIKIRGRIK
jgi:hypothetical protein